MFFPYKAALFKNCVESSANLADPTPLTVVIRFWVNNVLWSSRIGRPILRAKEWSELQFSNSIGSQDLIECTVIGFGACCLIGRRLHFRHILILAY